MCRRNTNSIDYDYNEIRPFLCKSLPNPTGLLHGEAAYATTVNDNGEYYYHVTNFGNFKSIINSGLLCSRGGEDGAGTIMANGVFKGNETGNVFATASPDVVDRYIYNYDELADNYIKAGNTVVTDDDKLKRIRLMPVLLRFKPLESEIWIRDPKQRGAVKGANDIDPSRLEFLGFEGWFSLNSYFARRKVKGIIDEIIVNNS